MRIEDQEQVAPGREYLRDLELRQLEIELGEVYTPAMTTRSEQKALRFLRVG